MSENKYYDKTNPKDLMPTEILDNVPKLYEQDGVKAKDKVVHAAYVIAFGSDWTWYLNEYDEKSGRAFGLVAGDFVEWGYFDVNELKEFGAERLILEDFPKTFEEIKDTALKKQLTKDELDLAFNGELSFEKEEKSVDLIKEIIISDLKEKDVNDKGTYKYDSKSEVYTCCACSSQPFL